ncbi:hypothetical protein B0H15DRAFT_852910 [Mycena belliarum]|uniref:F-box domain-containing protein n=1 Tax=Mycena belliarum TaxID=1033014 RepID=A0AAD6TWW5_9AGAR|nr:hypothetical protein B0H15DRAFT_852910 [Mycena belliae]
MSREHLRSELANIDAALAEHASKTTDPPSDLLERRKSVQLRLDEIVSVSCLPPEIISEVFIKYTEGLFRERPAFTLLLLKICQLWRYIALSTPPLWDDLTFMTNGSCTNEIVAECVRDWLSCAGSTQRLTLYGHLTKEATNLTHAILLRQSASLDDLSLLMDADATWALENIGQFTRLRKLTLGSLSRHPDFARVEAFRTAPLLTKVSFGHRSSSRFAVLPWAQLTIVEADGFVANECLTLLRDARMLKKCTFGQIRDMEDDAAASTRVVHTSLEQLTISGSVAHLVPCLVLPALRTLSMAPTRDSTTPISLAWLRTTPALCTLKLERLTSEIAYGFLSALNRAADPRFLPQLRTLEIHTLYVDIDGQVLDALRSRYADPDSESSTSTVHFQSLRIVCGQSHYHIGWEEAGDIDWDGMDELYCRGLDIHVGPQTQNFLEEW